MFKDRKEAGELLVKNLKKLQKEGKIVNPIVVALPRGGIPVGLEIAKELNAPLDLLFIKKIPSPFNEEVGIGSISESGLVFLNKDLIEHSFADEEYIKQKTEEKIEQIKKLRAKYKYDPILLEGKDVILVDDGVATGSSIYLAAQSIVRDLPRSIIIAIPVAPNGEKVLNMLKNVSNHLEIILKPDVFISVGRWYEDFHQLSDEKVVDLLKKQKNYSKDKFNYK